MSISNNSILYRHPYVSDVISASPPKITKYLTYHNTSYTVTIVPNGLLYIPSA